MSPGKNQKGIACLFEFTWMPSSTVKGEPASKFYFRVLDYYCTILIFLHICFIQLDRNHFSHVTRNPVFGGLRLGKAQTGLLS